MESITAQHLGVTAIVNAPDGARPTVHSADGKTFIRIGDQWANSIVLYPPEQDPAGFLEALAQAVDEARLRLSLEGR